MELLKFIQNAQHQSNKEKEFIDEIIKHIWQRHGPIKSIETKIGENGMPYIVVKRGKP